MLVSVIIKTRNEAERLRLVLASLSRQTIPIVSPGSRPDSVDLAAEVVVVDDGSTDRTAELLHSGNSEVPVLHIRHVPGRGRSAAANSGAEHASGEVLVFLDGDVLACPEFCERHAQARTCNRMIIFSGGASTSTYAVRVSSRIRRLAVRGQGSKTK